MAFALLLAVFLASTGILVGGAMNRPAQPETAAAADVRGGANAPSVSLSLPAPLPASSNNATQSQSDAPSSVKSSGV
ncbi:hypothetical protein [Paraburkholderia sp. J94]|uniref:hypothetical protein n=1 Tax=Paraburkholderia sp. J94 TaxID=2805441 RepID=UPI002AB05F26|nr:hypothetical protein [Paraburkholderia sp. J94]